MSVIRGQMSEIRKDFSLSLEMTRKDRIRFRQDPAGACTSWAGINRNTQAKACGYPPNGRKRITHDAIRITPDMLKLKGTMWQLNGLSL